MHNFCKLRELYHLIQDLENEIQEAHGLSTNECLTLCKINSGCTSSTELVDLLGHSKPRISKVLKGLESKKLITRQLDAQDKRKVIFVLTQSGIEKAIEVEHSKVTIPDIEIIGR